MMNREQFAVWATAVRMKVHNDIQREIYISGQFPQAIIVGGEYQYAFIADRQEFQLTAEGGYLWRGIPLIRSGAHNKVSVVYAMEDIVVPLPPEEKQVSSSPVGSANNT